MYTILGSKGFIGSNLLKHLEETNQECFAAPRGFVPSKEKNLGHVLFTDFALPFEVSSILFLAAMVGAVMLGKKEIK